MRCCVDACVYARRISEPYTHKLYVEHNARTAINVYSNYGRVHGCATTITICVRIVIAVHVRAIPIRNELNVFIINVHICFECLKRVGGGMHKRMPGVLERCGAC